MKLATVAFHFRFCLLLWILSFLLLSIGNSYYYYNGTCGNLLPCSSNSSICQFAKCKMYECANFRDDSPELVCEQAVNHTAKSVVFYSYMLFGITLFYGFYVWIELKRIRKTKILLWAPICLCLSCLCLITYTQLHANALSCSGRGGICSANSAVCKQANCPAGQCLSIAGQQWNCEEPKKSWFLWLILGGALGASGSLVWIGMGEYFESTLNVNAETPLLF
jgi:hypothetical protein